MTSRVAIYAAPGTGSVDAAATILRQKAEAWIGRGAGGGLAASELPTGWSRAAIDDITKDARRYGFHGTLKAPFRLAEGCTLEQLDAAVARLAAAHHAVAIPQLAVNRIGSFFALVPGETAPDLNSLADALVIDLDEYRAPVSAQEFARRNPATLTTRQRELFEAWGYPYVLDEFIFHLTLTSAILAERQSEVHDVLADWFADSLGQSIPIDAIVLVTEAEPGARFELHTVHPLQPQLCLPTATTFDHEGLQ